jgi:ElaB/YqjD/DUF883 family membrane-anchored ribosome-binding protein
MDNEDVIRDQMKETRTSLTDKLETLEQQVTDTVQETTSNVAETVEAVKETVESVKDTVQETVATVKESVDDALSAVKDTVHESVHAVQGLFDVPGHVRAHPWLMFGGSIAVGFLLEPLLAKAKGTVRYERKTFLPDHATAEESYEFPQPAPSAFAGLLKTFEPEIARLKGLALGAVMMAVRDLASQAVPPNIAPALDSILDDVARKVGGEVPRQPATPARSHGNGKR